MPHNSDPGNSCISSSQISLIDTPCCKWQYPNLTASVILLHWDGRCVLILINHIPPPFIQTGSNWKDPVREIATHRRQWLTFVLGRRTFTLSSIIVFLPAGLTRQIVHDSVVITQTRIKSMLSLHAHSKQFPRNIYRKRPALVHAYLLNAHLGMGNSE